MQPGCLANSLQRWSAADPVTAQVEIYAVQADVVLLLAALLGPGDILVAVQGKEVTGRLSAIDVPSAVETMRSLAPDVAAKLGHHVPSAPVEVSHYRLPVGRIVERIMGHSMTWQLRLPAMSLFARGVEPAVALGELLDTTDLEWAQVGSWGTLARRGNEALMRRLARSKGPRIDALFENVKSSDALNLLREVTPVHTDLCWGRGDLWLQAHDEPSGHVVARLVSMVDPAKKATSTWPCSTPLWSGREGLEDTDAVVGIVHQGSKSAALLRTGRGDEILRPGKFEHGVIEIDPTSVSITYHHKHWSDDIQTSTVIEAHPYDPSTLVPPDMVLTTLDIKRWRLAATLRLGDEWLALVVSPQLEWAWLRTGDKGVHSIERGAASLESAGVVRRLELSEPEVR